VKFRNKRPRYMTSRTAATRYARALLDVASRETPQGGIEQAADELDAFTALIRQNPELDRVLTNPAVPAPRKRAAVAELTGMARLSPIVSKLLILLAERDRLLLLNDVASIYRDLLMDRQNVVRAEVTTAAPLAAEKTQAIEKELSAVTGKRVAMTTKVDKDILGGVVARVGGTVYDASIATQLKKIRERLAT
jgi:F-type H+-transporting ATPase subunit delta